VGCDVVWGRLGEGSVFACEALVGGAGGHDVVVVELRLLRCLAPGVGWFQCAECLIERE
jgi:hypothetical protein